MVGEVSFKRCDWEEISAYVARNVIQNKITVDSFWEGHVLESNHYKMVISDEIVGYFAIFQENTIVLFHVNPEYAKYSQELFAKIKQYEQVTNAMVATGDEQFLSHCFDNFAKVEKQAYFSTYRDEDICPSRQKDLVLKLADVKSEADLEILKLCGDFLDSEIKKIQAEGELTHLQIYLVYDLETVVGFGVVEYGRIIEDIASIGMYVIEDYRGKGYATNILQSLKHISQAKGHRVFSGCWYYNHNSLKSMKSANAYSNTRLIRFYF